MRFTGDSLIADVLRADSGSAAVFERFGLGCASCLAADIETLASVAYAHDVSVTELLDALNSDQSGPSDSEV